MKRSLASAIVVGALAAAISLPATAVAFQVTGGGGRQTQNPYGLWYAGQEACAKDGCHAAIASKPTPHSEMVKDVQMFPSALIPAADSEHWPYLSSFGGVVLKPKDVYLQIGDSHAGFLEYAGTQTNPLGANLKPADELPLWDPMEWEFVLDGWKTPGVKLGNRIYLQSCAPCHNVGVTRPSNSTFTLANGAVQTSGTPSTVSALSIQCEVCHGTGENPDGHKKGVPGVVAGTQILKAQVCGQCHVSGAAPQKNFAGGSFGNPNGYTTDEPLSDYYTPFTTVDSEETFMNYVANGGTKPRFLPNGANYSLRHSYYNEWLNNKVPSHVVNGGMKGHADPVNLAVVGTAAGGNTKCFRCHSGLGFLNRIGAKGPNGVRIVGTFPTLSEVQANDPGISCQVCHTGHVGMGEHESYDSMRRWESGKEVSCGDCHNWQFEALDQKLQSETIGGVTYSRPAANTVSGHPQREVFTGGHGGEDGTGGMWGVAPMDQTMPGTKCQNCHMPRTSKEGMPADDDGTNEATRQSHRFHVVEPGDAARYKLRPNGDSCAPSCHKEDASGYTREDMQSWIDQKKTGVANATKAAQDALNVVAVSLGLADYTKFIAAQPVSGAAAAISPSRWAMLQRAAQNVDIVINDASGGIHNPAYVLAGLAKAKFWAGCLSGTVDASFGSAPSAGEGMGVVGTVYGDGHVALPGADVVLETSTDGAAWTTASTGRTNGRGAFTLATGRIVGARSYRVRFSPSTGVDYVSATLHVAAPTTTARVTPSGAATTWTNITSARVTISSEDGSAIYYMLSGATTRAKTRYTGPFTITKEGRTDVSYWASEGGRVEPTQQLPVKIDRGKPTIHSDLASVCANKADVHVWASDAGAGVSKIHYDFGPMSSDIDGATFTFSTQQLGKRKLVVRATDGAGKSSSRTLNVWVKAAPSVSMSPKGTSTIWVGESVSFATRVTRGTNADGTSVLLTNRPLILQRWDGRTWVTWKRFSTGDGTVSWTRTFSSKGTTYWRWRVPADDYSYAANSAVLKVVAK